MKTCVVDTATLAVNGVMLTPMIAGELPAANEMFPPAQPDELCVYVGAKVPVEVARLSEAPLPAATCVKVKFGVVTALTFAPPKSPRMTPPDCVNTPVGCGAVVGVAEELQLTTGALAEALATSQNMIPSAPVAAEVAVVTEVTPG